MKRKVPPLLEKLANEERAFLNKRFIAPRLPNCAVTVRIAGVILDMLVEPPDFSGWGIFQPKDRKTAVFLEEPSMVEKETYLHLFPSMTLVVCGRDQQNWYGVPLFPANFMKVTGRVPIQFAEEVQLFDPVIARFDGAHFWYEQPNVSRGPEYAEFLRESLANLVELPEKSGLLAAEHQVYQEVLLRQKHLIEEANRDKNEDKLRAALEHSGAVFLSYLERKDGFTVEYTVDGQHHRSTVDKNLRVQSAGICLSGRDNDFDLTSLAEVVRDGIHSHLIVRLGDNRNLAESDDW